MAASALMDSCATLDDAGTTDSTKDADVSLDQAKSIFATRLAICEILEAKASIPGKCEAFVPSDQNTRKKGFMGRFTSQGATKPTLSYPVYESSTEQHLDQCRTALASRSQWWTSYSNSRQNAVSLCHAVRGAIEKDEALHLHKVLAETTRDVAQALRDAKGDFGMVQQAFHDLVIHAHDFHVSLVDEDQARQEEIRRSWAAWLEQMEQGVDGLAGRIREVNANLRDTGVQVVSSGEQAIGTIKDIMVTVNELISQHSKEVALISEDAEIAHERLQYINELFRQSIGQQVYALTKSLDTSNSLAQMVNQNLDQINFGAAGSAELVAAIGTQLHAMSTQIQALKDDHDEMRETVNGTMIVVTELRGEVEATRTAMAAITGFFTSLTDAFRRVPTLIWCLFWIGAFIALIRLICACPGGPALLTLSGRMLLDILRLGLSHSTEIIGAILTVAFFTLIESPTHLLHRWQTLGVSTFEQVFAGVWAGIVIGAWAVAIVKRRLGGDAEAEEIDYAADFGFAGKHNEEYSLPTMMAPGAKRCVGWLNVADWYNGRKKGEGEIAI